MFRLERVDPQVRHLRTMRVDRIIYRVRQEMEMTRHVYRHQSRESDKHENVPLTVS